MERKEYVSQEAGKVILAAGGFWAFVPNPLPPEIIWSAALVSALSEAERDLSRLSALIGAVPFPSLLIQPFIRNEAVLSSRIEGTRASLADLYTYEAVQLSFLERGPDVHEVHNYVRAMDYGLARLKTLPISLRLLRELHEKLTENVRGGTLTPGEFRRSQNWIGPAGSTPSTAPYVPPPVDEMHQALDALEKFIHAETQIPALIRAGMIHYQFEAIHPFLDGNGRVGRLLIVLLFCDWGLLSQPMLNLSTYIEHHRQEYYDLLLRVSQKGDWDTWLRFFLRGVSEQSRESLARMVLLQELRTGYQELINQQRNAPRMAAVVDFLFSRPVFSIQQMAQELQIPFKTVQAYLQKLERAGVVQEMTGKTRNRIYQADAILRAVQGLKPG